MLRNTLHPIIALALLSPAAIPAQPMDAPPSERLAERRLATLVDYLELSEAQTWEWQTLTAEQREERRAAGAALREDLRSLQERLEAGATDATEIGRLVLDLHERKRELEAARAADMAELEQLLTPDQVDKLRALEAARDLRPIGSRAPGPRGRFGAHQDPGSHAPDRIE